ncbi:MAG: hypothetical protein KA184_00125 [Candidatus Hydrogenedentes bacterium]|nr:hypothetical protein [Candidatus Hydrogenedentota bacterium]
MRRVVHMRLALIFIVGLPWALLFAGCGGSDGKEEAPAAAEPVAGAAARPQAAALAPPAGPPDLSEPDLTVLAWFDRLPAGDVDRLLELVDPTSALASGTEDMREELAQTPESESVQDLKLTQAAIPLVYAKLVCTPKIKDVSITDRDAVVSVVIAKDADGDDIVHEFALKKRIDETTREFGWYIVEARHSSSIQVYFERFLSDADGLIETAMAEDAAFREAVFDLGERMGPGSRREMIAEERAKLRTSEQRIGRLADALKAYAADHEGEAGPKDLVAGLFPAYIDSQEAFKAPGDTDAACGYYYAPPERPVGATDADPRRLVLCEKRPNSRVGVFALFEDGQIRIMEEEDLEDLIDTYVPSVAAAEDSQNNLKQFGLVLKMFANESRGEKFPPLAPRAGVLMFDGAVVYPEYLTDLTILVNPAHPDREAQAQRLSGGIPGQEQVYDFVNDVGYVYLGYLLENEQQGLVFCRAYPSLVAEGKLDDDLLVGMGEGNVGGSSIYRLREGIERFLITDINNPAATAQAQSAIPVMWEWPLPHSDGSISVLYMDGHVDRVPKGLFPNTDAFLDALRGVQALRAP